MSFKDKVTQALADKRRIEQNIKQPGSVNVDDIKFVNNASPKQPNSEDPKVSS